MRQINPFYLYDKSVVPELVLLVRLLALYLFLTKESPFGGNQGAGRHYPVLSFLESLGTDTQFNTGMYLIFTGGILVIWFTPYLRTGAFAVGMAFIVGIVSCQTCISVAHLFTACMFMCTALSNHTTGTALIRFQLIVLYLGADLNKILDTDWWTGASIETLLSTKHQIEVYMQIARLFPPLFLSQMAGIGVMVLQLAIPLLLCYRKMVVYAMLLALLLHLPMVLLMQMTFGPFLFALLLAYGALLKWPRRIGYQPGRNSAALTSLLTRLDFNQQMGAYVKSGASESVRKWLLTFLDFLPHPALLFMLTTASAGLVRYGMLFPLGMLILLVYFTRVWPLRKSVTRDTGYKAEVAP
ncbi:hypothetical protein DYBT9275_02431 [Dyadobacter sp. CECT 9275]|uniref:HTTM domain-containing protein n=1 Tax=Dyadobacter helix TaxID=2822344 RepID=A0A916N4F6_9BACT|nr:HTTM domain-containing protein [Dyadobacter sp. CECT 9275]CAG5000279.1 hypothetical protein DYBT9275_02431 [Dyadobacter sp. CECT 9275]